MKSRSIASTFALLSAGVILVAGCQSGPSGHVPASYYSGTALDRNTVSTRSTTEYLEVNLNPADSQLRLEEIARIKGFLAAYNARGHGLLSLSVPQDSANPQLTISALAETRDLAWNAGIEYDQIAGSAYSAEGRANAPIILAFTIYKAIAPDCPSLAQVDVANARSNSDMPTLGCAVRTNMAAMIADPRDFLGERELEGGDTVRRNNQLEAYRNGEATAAARSDDESGAISAAVN